MAARNVLFALAAVLLLGCVLASHKQKDKTHESVGFPKRNGLLDVMPHGNEVYNSKIPVDLLEKHHHHLQKRFFGIHLHHKRPKVYVVNPVPHQVVYIKKHHRHHSSLRPRLSVHLGHRRHHHHRSFSVHLGR